MLKCDKCGAPCTNVPDGDLRYKQSTRPAIKQLRDENERLREALEETKAYLSSRGITPHRTMQKIRNIEQALKGEK